MTVSQVDPPEPVYSSYLNSKIKDIHALTERIAMALGYPQINVEAHTTQVHDNIAQACELFTKYAGYTEEYLIFHTTLYEKHKGLYMPKLFENTPELNDTVTEETVSLDTDPIHTTNIPAPSDKRLVYSYQITPGEQAPVEFTLQFTDDYYHQVQKMLISAVYNDITDEIDASVAEYGHSYVTETAKARFTVETAGDYIEIYVSCDIKGVVTIRSAGYTTQQKKTPVSYSRSMDTLLNAPRKVVDLFSFEEGTTSGINTLFTIEQTLAQQTYFSYAMGKYGFDLISWYTLKEWMETRQKLLQQKYYWRFNEREQRMYLTPEPKSWSRAEFWGAIGAYVEKPLKHVLQEPWVYQYALALTKITIARIRGKYQGTNLFGGGSPNYSELLSEGNTEKAALEQRLTDGASPGFGDAAPPMFFVG